MSSAQFSLAVQSPVSLAAAENALARNAASLPPLTVIGPQAIRTATPVAPGVATAGIDQADVNTPYLGRFVDSRA